jgi:hypothetical protein
MDVGTRRIFSEDHDLFRESARRFFQEEVVPHHSEYVLSSPGVTYHFEPESYFIGTESYEGPPV